MHRIHSVDRIDGFRTLSARETQLIVLASEGLTDKEIAKYLGISNGTVVTMWYRMRAKLGISSRVSAVAVVVTAVSRLCERALVEYGLPGDTVSCRVLVSAKQIVLSSDGRAYQELGIRPGDSLQDRLAKCRTLTGGEPAPNEPCCTKSLLDDHNITGFELADPTLGKTSMLEFTRKGASNRVSSQQLSTAS